MSFRIGIILDNSHEFKILLRKQFRNLPRLSGTYFHNTVSADFKVSTAFTCQAAIYIQSVRTAVKSRFRVVFYFFFQILHIRSG